MQFGRVNSVAPHQRVSPNCTDGLSRLHATVSADCVAYHESKSLLSSALRTGHVIVTGGRAISDTHARVP